MSSIPPLLKPMSAGDILDRAIRIYRENFVSLVTIVAIISLPVLVVQAIASLLIFPNSNGDSDLALANPSITLAFLLLYFVVSVVGGIFSLFQLGALVSFISERFLGRTVTVRQAYANAFRRWLSLLIGALLFGLGVGGVFLLLFGGAFVPVLLGTTAFGGGSSDTASALAGFGVLCLCLLFIPVTLGAFFLAVRWAFWIQAIVLESYNSTGALGRSWKLARGSFWRVLGFYVLLGILVYALTLGLVGATSLGAILLRNPLLQVVFQSITGGLIGIIISPLQIGTLTILYYDLRIRREGFDLQMQLQDASALPGALPSPAEPTSPQPLPSAEPALSTSVPPNPLAPNTPSLSTSSEPPLDLPPLFSRDEYTPK